MSPLVAFANAEADAIFTAAQRNLRGSETTAGSYVPSSIKGVPSAQGAREGTSSASINSVDLKHLVKGLTYESEVKVEKIGSGIWYCLFPSEEKWDEERTLSCLEYVEHSPYRSSITIPGIA